MNFAETYGSKVIARNTVPTYIRMSLWRWGGMAGRDGAYQRIDLL